MMKMVREGNAANDVETVLVVVVIFEVFVLCGLFGSAPEAIS
jgi:hypothetical protein